MIDLSSVAGYTETCRSTIGKLRETGSILGLMREGGENLGFPYHSRVIYFVNLAEHLVEMAAEAMYHAANLAPDTDLLAKAEGSTLREWTFDVDGDMHEVL